VLYVVYMKQNHVQKNIMRRVYYAFAIRLMTHPLLVSGVVFGAALVLFARNVHVERVVDAFLSIPVGSVPQFIVSALAQGEVVTLCSLVAMGWACYRVLSYLRTLSVTFPRHHYATN
jgi:hypothetical protein